jgi:hypothetical protein
VVLEKEEQGMESCKLASGDFEVMWPDNGCSDREGILSICEESGSA